MSRLAEADSKIVLLAWRPGRRSPWACRIDPTIYYDDASAPTDERVERHGSLRALLADVAPEIALLATRISVQRSDGRQRRSYHEQRLVSRHGSGAMASQWWPDRDAERIQVFLQPEGAERLLSVELLIAGRADSVALPWGLGWVADDGPQENLDGGSVRADWLLAIAAEARAKAALAAAHEPVCCGPLGDGDNTSPAAVQMTTDGCGGVASIQIGQQSIAMERHRHAITMRYHANVGATRLAMVLRRRRGAPWRPVTAELEAGSLPRVRSHWRGS